MGDFKYISMGADSICSDVHEHSDEVKAGEVRGVRFVIFPHVYPSHKFRSTGVSLDTIAPYLKEKKVCDMGCGPGIVGLYALKMGAEHVVQADINPYAIENAKENNVLNGYSDDKVVVLQSNCFDDVPTTYSFDTIVFNMPYHCDNKKIKDPLEYAFYDPNFASIRKFLETLTKYSHKDTKVFVAFSNKGEVDKLEHIFDHSGMNWELHTHTNQDQEYDNRMYMLTFTS